MHTPERVPSMPKADATRTMAATQMKKAALLEDLNMLLLMTMPEDKITTAEAREYLRLRKGDELKKLRRKLAVEEDRERSDAASVEEEVANPRRPSVVGSGKGGVPSTRRGRVRSPAAEAAVATLWETQLRQTHLRRMVLRSVSRRGLGPRAPRRKMAMALATARFPSHRVPGGFRRGWELGWEVCWGDWLRESRQ